MNKFMKKTALALLLLLSFVFLVGCEQLSGIIPGFCQHRDADDDSLCDKCGEAYVLSGKTGMRSRTMLLNGRELKLLENDELPALEGVAVEGKLEIPATACAFVVI